MPDLDCTPGTGQIRLSSYRTKNIQGLMLQGSGADIS